MGLEHYPDVRCPIQAVPGRTQSNFRVLGKARAVVAQTREMRAEIEADQGRPLEELDWNIHFTLEGLQEGVPSSMKMGEAFDEWDKLAAGIAPVCADCPLNAAKAPVGCYASITYPITEAGERWLIDNFNPPRGDMAYLPYHFKSGGVTGERMEADRPGTMLSGPAPFRKRLAPGGPEYTSSQIIEYLMCCMPELLPQTLFALSCDFGVVQVDPADEQLMDMALGMNDMLGATAFKGKSIADWKRQFWESYPVRFALDPDDDRSVYKFKQFLLACWRAFCFDAKLVIDG